MRVEHLDNEALVLCVANTQLSQRAMHQTIPRRACLLAFAGILACRPTGESPDTSNSRPASKQRIVSITPNTTEAVFAIGAGQRMVGRSRFCNYPPEASRLPSVGGYIDPSLETILGLRPDLVTGARGPMGRNLVDKLEARGTECYFPSTESVQEIFAMIEGLARRLDAASEGAQLIESISNHLTRIENLVKDRFCPRTLLVFGQAPVSVAGPGSFPAEMLALAGCINAVELGVPYPILGFETMIGMDPDIIIDATMAGGQDTEPITANRPGWASLRAVREGSIIRLDNDQVLRPGPRVAEGVAILARHTHVGLDLPWPEAT